MAMEIIMNQMAQHTSYSTRLLPGLAWVRCVALNMGMKGNDWASKEGQDFVSNHKIPCVVSISE